MNEEEESFIIDKIKTLEQSLNGKIIEIENRNNVFRGSITIKKPIIFQPRSNLEYKIYNIGYNYSINIESKLNIISDIETEILSFTLPTLGVWMIKYRLEINFSLGFTCLKTSRIKLEGERNKFIDNINNIPSINQLTITTSDTVIITGEVNLKLKCLFTFGRSSDMGIFTIVKNGDFPILNITRIA